MKFKLLLTAGACCLITATSLAQEKTKIGDYIEQIKNSKAQKSKRSLGLELIGNSKKNKNTISKDWIKKGDKVLITTYSNTNIVTLEKDLISLGVTEIKKYGNVITGWMAMDSIPLLENCKTLNNAIPEVKPVQRVGLTTSQAVTTLFSGDASKQFNVNGSGIKIGIMSDSYNARGDAQTTVASGDLPGAGNPNGFTNEVVVLSEIADLTRGTDEGRGMAELVHDVAPGAEIYQYSATNGFFDFADGIRALADAGCAVIVDDIGYLAEPNFQDSVIAQAVDEVTARGVVYLSAAGNSGTSSYEAPYKEFIDGNGISLHDFGDENIFQTLTLAPNDRLNLFFQWDDPSFLSGPTNPVPDTDLDILLIDNTTGDLIDFSANSNSVSGLPLEILQYQNTNTTPQDLDILIIKNSGPTPRRIKYIDFGNSRFNERVEGINASTCFGHANAKGAISVGAQAYIFNPEFGNPLDLNRSSSYGGTPILLDVNGNSIELIDRMKPDVVGPDFTNTTSFPNPAKPFFDLEEDGFPNFGGTSAAAPHIAAVVALMLEEKPDLTPADVVSILHETAIDMDNALTEGFDVGYDVATGYGYVQADKALAALQSKPTVYRYQIVNATTNNFVQTIRNDDQIDLSRVNGGILNVIALATDGLDNPASLVLNLSGTEQRKELDNNFPYSLFGDDGQGNFRNWEAKNGDYSLSSKAFSQMNGVGDSGENYAVNFSIGNNSFISSFILVNADTNEDIGPISESLDLSTVNASNVTIRAVIGSEITPIPYVEKVQFNLSGAQQRYTEDTSAPFSLFTDNNGNFFPWQPKPIAGVYTIDATPFARRNGTGTGGIKTTLTFEIINDTITNIVTTTIDKNISIASNSSTGLVTVSSNVESRVAFTVYNAQGGKVYSGVVTGTNENIIDLKELGSGLFIIKSEDGVSINQKLYAN